jgi:hypothetical protein
VTEPGARGGYFAKIVLNVSSISFLPRTRPVGAAADGGKNIVRVLGEKWHESREVAVAKRRQELGHDALASTGAAREWHQSQSLAESGEQ